MALYAFDGTSNIDEEEDIKDTNVVRFKELYNGTVQYVEGVGTRFSAVGRVFGGLFGTGGRTRIEEMYEALCDNWEKGDHDIDIIGFSRGSALAVHFANKIGKEGIKKSDGSVDSPKIRFLGIWDLVASFGLSLDTIVNFHDINLGWDIDQVTDAVEHCCHGMSLDERREAFGESRMDPDKRFDHVDERWFRGVHSDVGGGNQNPDRSNIALKWMLENAVTCGLPMDLEKAKEAKYSKIDLDAPVFETKDVVRDPRRPVLDGDVIDPSAVALPLEVGQEHTCTVISKLKNNWSRVRLIKGAGYKVTVSQVPPDNTWEDGKIECGPSGWDSERLPWYKEEIIELAERWRRYPEANWFELIGSHGDEDTDLVRLGTADTGAEFKAVRGADLYLFANDLKSRYGNNKGYLKVTIRRVS